MAGVFLDFEWLRPKRGSGFVLADAYKMRMDDERLGAFIVKVGQEIEVPQFIHWEGGADFEVYRPLEKFPFLHLLIAKVETPGDVLQFCNKYGPLVVNEGKIVDFPVPEFLRLSAAVRGLLALLKSGKTLPLADLASEEIPAGLSFRADKRGGVKLTARVTALSGALALHVIANEIAGNIWRACEHCGNPFKAGPDSKPRRRLDAKTCSTTCHRKKSNLNRSIGD